jgi:hypothetical protein
MCNPHPTAIFPTRFRNTLFLIFSLSSHNDQLYRIDATEITHRQPHQPQTIAKMPAADVGASMNDIRRILTNINVVDRNQFCKDNGLTWSKATLDRFFKSFNTRKKGLISVSGWQLVVQCCYDAEFLDEHDTASQGVINYCMEYTEYDSDMVHVFVSAAESPSPSPSLANIIEFDFEGDGQENEEHLRTDITVSPSGLHDQENVCLDEYPSSVQARDNLPYLNIRTVGTLEHAGGSAEGQVQTFDDDGKTPTINPTAGRATLFGTSSNKPLKTPTLPHTPVACPSTNTSSALSASKQKTASAASSDQPWKLIQRDLAKVLLSANLVDDSCINRVMRAQCCETMEALFPSKQNTAPAASSDQSRKLVATVAQTMTTSSGQKPNHNAPASSNQQILKGLVGVLSANVGDGDDIPVNRSMRAHCYETIEGNSDSRLNVLVGVMKKWDEQDVCNETKQTMIRDCLEKMNAILDQNL